MNASTAGLPSYADVLAAARRLRGQARRTPLLENEVLDDRAGARVLIKAEPLQRTGTFKFRGAYNRLAQLDAAERRAGVVAFSSGNHAQGVAAAARMLGIAATIVMPEDAPRVKLERTRALGAQLVLYDRYSGDREAIAARLASERGAVLVPSYDDADIIAGQGTVALELLEQAEEAGIELDAVLIPCGGGGLTSGCALVLAERSPAARLYTVEPEAFDDTRRSLAAGHRLAHEGTARSFCDALLSPSPGRLTFAIMQRYVTAGLAVDDAEVGRAVAFAVRHLKLVLEPGGAAALAAVLANRIPGPAGAVAVICSGGNVDDQTLIDCLCAWPEP